eukprot:5914296-Pyramimonas_sp.AAC.2
MVLRFGHYNITVPVHCHSAWESKLSGGGFSVCMARHTSVCQCGHQALRRNLADMMVLRFGHYYIAVPVHCYTVGPVELWMQNRPESESLI